MLAASGPPAIVYVLWDAGERGDHRWSLSAGAEVLLRTPDLGLAVAHLLWTLNRQAVACSPHDVRVHAAATEHDGAAVLLPGAPGAGKTTLAAGLVARGLRYLGDEVAAIDPSTLCVRAFPKPLTVKMGSQPLLAHLEPPRAVVQLMPGAWHVDPRRIRHDAVGSAAPARWVIAPEYHRGAATELVPITAGEAVVLLARHAFDLPNLGCHGLAALAAVATGSSCHRLVMGDLDSACNLVQDLLDRPHRPTPHRPACGRGPSPLSADNGARGPVTAKACDARVMDVSFRPARASAVATVQVDGEAVLLDEATATLHLLEPLAATVWGLFDGETTITELAAELAAAFGERPGVIGADLVAFTTDLAGRGLLQAPVEP
ncbi:MAG: PqqD family peptide modification chaperone [Acidimicrobiales bacterium]